MTDQTPEQLADRLTKVRRQMAFAATDQPTPEQLAEWEAADTRMAQRIHKIRPGVPLHHAFAALNTLRTIQTMDRAGNPDREERIQLDQLTADDLEQLYDDLDRYAEVVGELNEANTGLTRDVARVEQQRDQLAAALSEVLGEFRVKTHPGESCLTTYNIPVARVQQWRAVLDQTQNG